MNTNEVLSLVADLCFMAIVHCTESFAFHFSPQYRRACPQSQQLGYRKANLRDRQNCGSCVTRFDYRSAHSHCQCCACRPRSLVMIKRRCLFIVRFGVFCHLSDSEIRKAAASSHDSRPTQCDHDENSPLAVVAECLPLIWSYRRLIADQWRSHVRVRFTAVH